VFWMDYTGEIGAYQVTVDYGATGGDFVGSHDQVACKTLAFSDDEDAGLLTSYNDVEEEKILHAGFIALPGFNGPVDLFSCKFELPSDRTGVHFVIRPEDAVDPELNPVMPLPTLGYRLE